MTTPRTLTPFRDFADAAEEVVRFLHAQVGFDTWAVARRREEELIYLRVFGSGIRLRAGESVSMADSISSNVGAPHGPAAVSLIDVAGRSSCPQAETLQVRAYAGIPLVDGDGQLMGALEGMARQPRSDFSDRDLSLIAIFGRSLATMLATDLREMDDKLRIEQMRAVSLMDPATGLGNRRYWTHLLAAEESRCRREGERSSVIVLDVDGPEGASESLRRAAYRLRAESRAHDVVARIGGNSLAVLAVGCSRSGAEAVADRIRHALASEGFKTFIGIAAGRPAATLEAAWRDAEVSMSASRRAARNGHKARAEEGATVHLT